jgi:PAS domain S-box-containing protein
VREQERGIPIRADRGVAAGLLACAVLALLATAMEARWLPWSLAPAVIAGCAAGQHFAPSWRIRLAGFGLLLLAAAWLFAPPPNADLLPPIAVLGVIGLVARARGGPGSGDLVAGAAGIALLLASALALLGPPRHGIAAWADAMRGLALLASALWLLRPLLVAPGPGGPSRLPRLAVAAEGGIGALVMLGWLFAVAVVVQGGTDDVPMQFNTALCHVLAALALGLMLQARAAAAAFALLPVAIAALATLLVEFFSIDVGIDELIFAHRLQAEGVPPGRMAPNTAISFLTGAIGMSLIARAARHPGLWIGVWTCGFLVCLSAITVLAGYVLDVPQARGRGSQTPMAAMTALAFAAHGLGLLFAGRERTGRAAHQRFWLPVLVMAGAVVLALQLGQSMEQQREARQREAGVLLANAAQRAIQDRLGIRLRALERMVERLQRIDAAQSEALFRLDARNYMRDFPSIAAMAWVDAELISRWIEARAPAVRATQGTGLDFEAQRRDAFARAASEGTPQLTRPLRLLDGSHGALIVLPLRHESATGIEFLAAGLNFARLFEDALAGLPAHPMRVRLGDEVLFAREPEALGPRAVQREIAVYDQRWVLEWGVAVDSGLGRLAWALLAGTILAGAWLALALRFAALVGTRASEAEASRSALEREMLEGQRVRTALDATERELVGVLSSIGEAFYLLDEDWRFVYLNPLAERLMGRAPGALFGKRIWDEFPEAGAGPVRVAFERAVREQETVAEEVHYEPLGAWFEYRAHPHRRGLAIYFREITAAKEAELANSRLQTIAERAQHLAQLGGWELDLGSGRLLWSRQAAAIFGMPSSPAVDRIEPVIERLHAEDRELRREAQRRLQAGEGDLDLHYRVLRPSGEVRHVHEIATLVRDADGHARLATGVIQDVTERHRDEEALREATRRLEQALSLNRAILDRSLDVICAIDANGRFAQVSPACERLWGMKPGELTSRPWVDFVHPEDRERTEAFLAGLPAGGASADFRNRHLARDGRIVAMQWSASWSPRERMVFGVARDVTAQEAQDAELIALRDRLLRAQQVARMGSWELDLRSGALAWSDEVHRIFEVRPGEFTGTFDGFTARVHPDDLPAMLTAQDQAVNGGRELDLEHRIVLPGGRVRHVHERGRVLHDAEGRPWLLSGSVQDITERRRIEEALRQNEAMLRISSRAARLGAWSVELPSRQVQLSDEACRIHDLPAGTTLDVEQGIAFFVPEHRARISEAVEEGVRTGAGWDEELILVTASGRRRWVRSIGEVLRGPDGRPVRLQGALQDVTERKQAELALRESEQRFKLVARATADAVWDWNLADNSVWWNEGIATLFGYAPDEVGADASFWSGNVHPDDHGRVSASIRLVLEGQGEDWEQEYRFRRRDGSWAHVVDRGFVIRDESGNALRMVGGMTDLSERRATQRALEKERQFLRALLENLTEGVVACDADGVLTTFNRATREIHGLDVEPLSSRDWAATYELHRPDGQLMRPEEVPLHRALQGETVKDAELLIITPGHEGRTVLCSGQPILDERGDRLGAVIAMHDVTERKRIERMQSAQHAILAGIAARRPLAGSLEGLVRLQEAQFPDGLASILLLDETGRHVRHGAALRLPDAFNQAIHGQAVGAQAGSCGTAAWRGERVVVTDIASDPLWADYAALALEHGLRAAWSTPVKSSSGEVLATFAIYYREPRAPDAAEIESVDGLAALASIAIEQERAYARLSLSEQRMRSLFDEHPDAVYSMDLAGRFTACNSGFERLTGRRREEVLGQFFDAGVLPEERDFVRAQFSAAARGEARNYEVRSRFEDGREADLRITNLPIVIDGEVVGVFGIAHDISQLRQRERDLGQALLRAETGSEQLRRLNEAAVIMNRPSTDAALYQQMVDLLRDTIGAHQALLMIAGQAAADAGGGDFAVSLSDKYAAYRDYTVAPDGSGIYALVEESNRPLRLTQAELEAHPRWRGFGAQAAAHPPMRGWLAVPLVAADGRNLGTLQLSDKYHGEFSADDEAVALQFAQMAAAAVERSALLARLRGRDRFFELSVELFAIADPGINRFIQVNPAFERLLGYPPGELTTRPFMDFIHPDDRAATAVVRDDFRESREPITEFVNRYVCADGSLRWLEWASVTDASGLVFAAARDITERRRTEAALQQAFEDLRIRNRELQDFAFVASHDLQEPLRKIRAFSDRLQSHHAQALDEQARDYLQRTTQAAARMQVLIGDLLAYSRVSSRGKPFAEVDLNRIAAAVVENLEARLESSGGRIELGPLPVIQADATQMGQLLQNLIANSLKFAEPGRAPRVTVSASETRIDGARRAWRIEIADNGIGFEPKYAERIFAPFQRLHGRLEYEGTGIGLAIVRRIVERHRGTIRAEGRPGEGATIVVVLPEFQPADPAGDAMLAPFTGAG